MKTYLTVYSKKEGLFVGDYIKAISEEEAEYILKSTNRGYMTVVGELISEIDEETGKKTDYSTYLMN